MNQQLAIQDLGTILGVWAHPDDEMFTCAGIMAAAIDNGQNVACITATKGELGVQDPERWPPQHLAEIRTRELEDSYRLLGVQAHHWLGYPDGGCHEVNEREAIAKLEVFIEQYSPDTIVTFGPEGMTGHSDHQAVSRWATKAGKAKAVRVLHAVLTPSMHEATKEADEMFNMFFNIDQPPIVPEEACAVVMYLEGDLLQKKCDALAAMESQTAKLIEFLGHERLCAMNAEEAFVLA